MQLDDCALDPQPNEPALVITAFEHQVGSLRGHDLGIFAALLHDEIGRAPDVDVRGRRQNSTTTKPPRNMACLAHFGN